MGQEGVEDKSLVIEEIVDDKGGNFYPKNIRFAHSATAGQKTIDLNSLVTPPSMLANGFVQPSPVDIAGANLSIVPDNLQLKSSRGSLIRQEDYEITAAGTINFLNTSPLGVLGAEEGEIFEGILKTVTANAQNITDAKTFDTTADDTNFTPGDTLINVGVAYKVNDNPFHQTGEVRAYKNGKRIYRNVNNAAASPTADGNFHEVDSGNGYGTMIELNVPAQAGDIFGFDFGLKVSPGDLQVFGQIERLQGAFLKLAKDAAVDFGTNLSDYIVADPTEIERRAFGDLVLSMLNAPIPAPKRMQNLYWADSANTMLQFSTGNVRFNTANIFSINTDLDGFEDGLITFADDANGTIFTATEDLFMDVSFTFPIDDNSSTARMNIVKSFNGGVFQTVWAGHSVQDERAGSTSVFLGMKAGDRIRFSLPLGQVFSTVTPGYLSILAQTANNTTTLKSILGI